MVQAVFLQYRECRRKACPGWCGAVGDVWRFGVVPWCPQVSLGEPSLPRLPALRCQSCGEELSVSISNTRPAAETALTQALSEHIPVSHQDLQHPEDFLWFSFHLADPCASERLGK